MNRLTEALGQLCKDHLLSEKWLIAPTLRIGQQWMLAVSRSGQPAINVRIQTLKRFAHTLAAADLSGDGRRELTPLAGMLLVDGIINRLRKRGELTYFGVLQPTAGFAQAVSRSLNELRIAGLTSAELQTSHFEADAKGRDLVRLLAEYERALIEQKWRDYADLLRLAVACVKRGEAPLTADALVLLPADARPSPQEQSLLDDLGERVVALPVDERAMLTSPDAKLGLFEPLCTKAALFQAIGEVNEIREVLRRCHADGVPLDDVEILHTDRAVYVPLVYETLAGLTDCSIGEKENFPATFDEGIPCRFSRPGRALLRWLEWQQSDYPQDLFVKMVREGLLNIPLNELALNYGLLAAACRGLRIGFGRDRYLTAIEARMRHFQRRLAESNPADDVESNQRETWERRIRDLNALRALAESLLAISAAQNASPLDVLAGALQFLDRLARRVDELDNYAHERLALEIRALQEAWPMGEQPAAFDVWEWLHSLPGEARVLGSRPRPGCLHVAPLLGGGHSGRPHTFIIGLDDSRFPGTGHADPLLLDDERQRISPNLELSTQRAQADERQFFALLARLRGKVTFSFSNRSLSDDRELFPSPAFLAAYRLVHEKPDADQSEVLQSLSPAASFAPSQPEECVNETDWWLFQLCGPKVVRNRQELLATRFRHLGQGWQACNQRASDAFTIYDGRVESAAADLDPTRPDGQLFSSRKLERAGRCPLSFFFQYGLEIKPPDDVSVDTSVWLDPRSRGALSHAVFEGLLRELALAERAPVYERDSARLQALLEEQVTLYRQDYPPPSDGVFQWQLRQLQRACHVFLKEEEEYCRIHGCRPIHLEEPFGMPPTTPDRPLKWPDPVALALPSGRRVRLCGRLDRVDLIGAGAARTFAVWDYKNNSSGYEQNDPFREGRVLQPYLYLTVVGHLLGGDVLLSGFFFPSERDRGKRMAWGRKDFAQGPDLLQRLCTLLGSGAFPATENAKEDCRFCDYRPICGDVDAVAAASRRKMNNPANTILRPYRELRGDAQA